MVVNVSVGSRFEMGCIQKINYTTIRGEMYQGENGQGGGGDDRGEFTTGESKYGSDINMRMRLEEDMHKIH